MTPPRKNSNSGRGKTELNISINAEDNASQVMKSTQESVSELEENVSLLGESTEKLNQVFLSAQKTLDITRAKMIQFGQVVVQTTQSTTEALFAIAGGFKSIADNQLIRSQVGGYFQYVYQSAIEATQETQKLSDILGTLASTGQTFGSSFLQGAFVGDGNFQLKLDQKGIYDQAIESFEGAFEAGNEVLKELLPKGIGDSLLNGAIGDITTDVIKKFVVESPAVRKLIPSALRRRFIEGIKGPFSPQQIARIVQGRNIFRSLEQEISFSLARGFTRAVLDAEKGIDKFVQDLFAGNTIGNQIAKALFAGVDLSSPFASLLDQIIRPGIESYSRNLSRSTKGLASGLIKGLLPDPKGVGGQITNLLFRNVAESVSKKASGAFFKKAGSVIATTLVSAIAAPLDKALPVSISERIASYLLQLGADKSLEDYVKFIEDNIKKARKAVSNFLEASSKEVVNSLSGFINPALATKIGRDISNLVTLSFQVVADKIRNIKTTIAEALQSVLLGAASIVSNPAIVNLIGQNLTLSLIRGLKSVSGAVEKFGTQTLAETFQNILIAAGEFVSSPKVVNLIGKQFSIGIIGGLKQAYLFAGRVGSDGILQAFKDVAPSLIEVGQFIAEAIFKGFELYGKVVDAFNFVDGLLDGLLSQTGARLAGRLIAGISGELSDRALSSAFDPLIRATAQVVDAVDVMATTVVDRVSELPARWRGVFDTLAKPVAYISGFNEPLELFQEFQNAFGQIADYANQASQSIFFFSSAIDSVRQLIVSGPYDAFIGANVRLQQQLLRTQASLVATNKIIRQTTQEVISNPGSAILALNATVASTLDQIRRDSLELVGVTSSQLVDVFNIVATEASAANISLKEAGKLTIDFSAALGTIGLPLDQAAQEIRSIFQGQITSDSALAKSLGLQNEQVKKLAQQGNLYDFLAEKLEAFTAGNALAAQTIEGISSNIQDIFEIVALEAGKPLIQPIVDQLNRVYQFMGENQFALVQYVSVIVKDVERVGLAIVRIFESIAGNAGDTIAAIPLYLFRELAAGAEAVADGIGFAMTVLKPFFGLLGELTKFVRTNLAGVPAKVAIGLFALSQTIGVLSKSFNILFQLLPGVGDLLFFISLRAIPLANQFTALSKTVGVAASSFLLMGQNLQSLPFVASLIADKFGLFGKILTPLIPGISSFGIAMIGLSQKGGVLGGVINELGKSFSDTILDTVLPGAEQLATNKGFPKAAEAIKKFSDKANEATKEVGILEFANQKLSEMTKEMGKAFRQQVLTMGLWSIAIAAASIAAYEYFKRIGDAGDSIRQLAQDSREGAALISSTWNEFRRDFNEPIVELNDLPSNDWIDEVILKTRQWNEGTLEVKNAIDVLYVAAAGVVNLGQFLVKVIQSLTILLFPLIDGVIKGFVQIGNMGYAVGEFIGGIAKAIQALFTSPAEAINLISEAATKLANDFTSGIQDGFNYIQQQGMATKEGLEETWSDFNITRKVEEEYQELIAAIDSGELQEAVNNEVNAVDKLLEEVPDAGAIYQDLFDPIRQGVKELAAGTKPLDEVKNQIATLPDAIPEGRKQAILSLLENQFPNGVNETSKAAKNLATVIKDIDAADLFNLDEVLEGLAEGTKTRDDVIAEMTKLKDILPTQQFNDLAEALYRASGTEEGMGAAFQSAQALNNGMAALNQSIDIAQTDSANIRLEILRDRIDTAIEGLQSELKTLEDLGQGYGTHAIEIRSMIKQYEDARTKLEEFSESVDIVADPIKKLEQFIANANQELDKFSAALETTSQNAIANLTEQLAEGDISQGYFDEENWKISNDMISRQLASTKQRLEEAYRQYNELGEDEKARAKEVQAAINELSKRYSALRIQQAESDTQRYKQMIENQVAAVRGALLGGEVSRQDELSQRTQIQLQENRRQLDIAKSSLQQLAAEDQAGRSAINAEIVKLMDERNQIIKDRDAEVINNLDTELQRGIDLIRRSESERQIEARETDGFRSDEDAVLKIGAEVEAIAANIDRVQQLRATLESQSPLNDPALEEERLDRINQLRQEELDLTLEGLDKEKEAWEQQTEVILNNINQRQQENLASIQSQINAGQALAEERGVVESQARLDALAIELERTSNVQKQAELLLQIEEARADLKNNTRDLELRKIELADTQRLTELSRDLLEGEISRIEISRETAQQNLSRLEQEIALTTDKASLIELERQRVEALISLREANRDLELAAIEDATTAELNRIEVRRQLGQAYSGETAIAQADAEIAKLNEQIRLETDRFELTKLRYALTQAEGAKIRAEIDLELEKTEEATALELNRIEVQRQRGGAFEGESAIARADIEISKLQKQLNLETDRVKVAQLQLSLTQARASKIDAVLSLELERMQAVTDAELNQIEIRRQQGDAYSAETQIAQTDAQIAQLEKQIELEKDLGELASLRLQLTQAQGQKVEAARELELQKLREAEVVELEALERRRRASGALAEELAIEEAAFNVAQIEKQLELEVDRVKKAELRLELVKAIGAVEDADLQKRLREVELVNTKELTRFRSLINQKRMLQEEYDVAVAEQEVTRVQEMISVEKDRGRQIELQLQLVESQGQLIEANIRLYEAKLNKESLKYENSIKTQNLELENQSDQFEKLNRSLQMRSQLLDAQRSLFGAGESYFIGELEAIASTTRSSRKRKQIEEIIAATKLKSAITQAKFEERSLQISQEQQRLELEREEISKRIALNEAKIAEQRAQAELKKAVRAGLPQEELEARKIEVDLARRTTQLRQQDLQSMDEIRALNEEVFAMQTQAQRFSTDAAIRGAQIQAAGAITNRRQRRSVERAINAQSLEGLGFGGIQDLADSASATSAQAFRESGLTNIGGASGRLSREERLRALRGESDTSGATLGSRAEIRRLTGGLTQGFRQPDISAAPLKLPNYLTPKIDVVELGKTLSSEAKGDTTISPTINVKIEGDKKVGERIKKEVEPRLEAIIERLVKTAS